MRRGVLFNGIQAFGRCLLSDARLSWLGAKPLPELSLSPPFPQSLYRRYLDEWRRDGVILQPLPARIQGVRTLALRHDLDTLPERALAFLEVEKAARVSGAYYFIVDGVVDDFPYSYRCADYCWLAERILESGGLIGMHSIAWSQPDGLGTFEREREKFEEMFGLPPAAWTHHGFLPAAISRRLRMKFELKWILKKRRQFTQARFMCLSDSAGARLPEHCPADVFPPNFPNEFMTHPGYWLPRQRTA